MAYFWRCCIVTPLIISHLCSGHLSQTFLILIRFWVERFVAISTHDYPLWFFLMSLLLIMIPSHNVLWKSILATADNLFLLNFFVVFLRFVGFVWRMRPPTILIMILGGISWRFLSQSIVCLLFFALVVRSCYDTRSAFPSRISFNFTSRCCWIFGLFQECISSWKAIRFETVGFLDYVLEFTIGRRSILLTVILDIILLQLVIIIGNVLVRKSRTVLKKVIIRLLILPQTTSLLTINGSICSRWDITTRPSSIIKTAFISLYGRRLHLFCHEIISSLQRTSSPFKRGFPLVTQWGTTAGRWKVSTPLSSFLMIRGFEAQIFNICTFSCSSFWHSLSREGSVWCCRLMLDQTCWQIFVNIMLRSFTEHGLHFRWQPWKVIIGCCRTKSRFTIGLRGGRNIRLLFSVHYVRSRGRSCRRLSTAIAYWGCCDQFWHLISHLLQTLEQIIHRGTFSVDRNRFADWKSREQQVEFAFQYVLLSIILRVHLVHFIFESILFLSHRVSFLLEKSTQLFV